MRKQDYIISALQECKQASYEWNITDNNITWSKGIEQKLQDISSGIYNMPTTLEEYLEIMISQDRKKFAFMNKLRQTGSAIYRKQFHIYSNSNVKIIDNGFYMRNTDNTEKMTGKIQLEKGNIGDYTIYKNEEFKSFLNQILSENSIAYIINISINNLVMISNWNDIENSYNIINQLITEIGSIKEISFINRISFDHIGIIAKDIDKKQFTTIINQIKQVIEKHKNIDENIYLRYSIGSTATNNKDCYETLINQSYLALQQAKNKDYSTHRCYSNSVSFLAEERKDIDNITIINNAYHNKDIKLAYQPIIDSGNGSVIAYEALMRIKDNGNHISAGPMIAAAEKFARIEIFDEYVMNLVVEDLIKNPELTLSFNISNLTAGNDDWLANAINILKKHDDICERLIIEITETYLYEDIRKTAYFIAMMQSIGCRVALDDFGAGFTSFKQLKNLSFDIAKIDGSYIKNLHENSENYLFVKKLTDFCQSYGIKTIAEYVENGEIVKNLLDLKIDYMQGYYFGKPQLYIDKIA